MEDEKSWVTEKVEEEEEEEEETTLVKARRSIVEKDDDKSKENEVKNGISERNGHANQSIFTANGAKNGGIIFGNELKIKEVDGVLEDEAEYAEGQQKPENLVFLDKVEGIWKCRICSWTHQNGIAHIDHIQNHSGQWPKQMNHKIFLNFETEGVEFNSGEEQVEKGPPEHGESEIVSQKLIVHASLTYSNVQGNRANYKSSISEIESAENDLINEDELEEAEVVETVLQKQMTHDLYCPNCNSCITRRVVLRKRKRRVQPYDEDFKRNRTESAAVPKSGICSAQVSDDELAENDTGRETGHVLFRCLSCFSLFIPTGNGSKLFRIFGDKKGKENVGNEKVPLPSRKKKRFASMFASDNQETTVEQDSTTEQSDGSTSVESMESKLSKELQVNSESDISVKKLQEKTRNTCEESAQDPVSSSQKGGLKLMVSSNDASPALENSEEDKINNQTIQKETPDEAVIQFLQTPVRKCEASDFNGKLDILAEIPHAGRHIEAQLTTELVVENGKVNSIRSYDYVISLLQYVFDYQSLGKDTVITIGTPSASEIEQGMPVSEETAGEQLTPTQIGVAVSERTEVNKDSTIEVVKSIVYGGLVESITSLSVVSSAAGGDVTTLNILALGLANLIGGFSVICHNLWELRSERIDQYSDQVSHKVRDQNDRYEELLGKRENFLLHAIVVILSYLIFGSLPAVVYGFSFRVSDNMELKLVMVGATSLLCITVLAIGKAYVCRPPKAYVKTVVTFIVLGLVASGISYVAGELNKRILEKLGLLQSSSVANLILSKMAPEDSAWLVIK